MKVTAIEEAHDITKLKLDELFGSLLTFEMAISHRENKKGKDVAFKINYRRKDSENYTRRFNEVSNRSYSDYSKKKEGEGRVFRCRECRENCHYQAECPTFLRRQKKNFRAILSDEDIDDSEEDNSMNAFIVCMSETDSRDESECFGEICDKNLTFEELKVLWKEDYEAEQYKKKEFKILWKKMND
ncbi:gag-pol polyprotein [Cucumis melo var. makuwa]|uniref:Gag-pol polyprotein n=1 Tax=Cucumis melo var. makuwa TaxID=1194695 RepID=A0A5D3CKY6_CUCMM|nr:gag-pol polyprotein [Cucumis melo var. makuwa]